MLSLSEIKIAETLKALKGVRDGIDQRFENFFFLEEKIKEYGLAMPPDMDIFAVPLSWPKVAAKGILDRSQVKQLLKTDPTEDTHEINQIWYANDLDNQIPLFNQDKAVFGRAFLSVGANPDSDEYPLILPESPRDLSVHVDKQRRRIDAALRVFQADSSNPFTSSLEDGDHAVLYLPTKTVHMARSRLGSKWLEVSRDEHNLGQVPIVMALNQAMTGKWTGRSQMEPVIPLTEMAMRTLTNTQFASETTAAPRKYAIGVQEADFTDAKTGEILSRWEAYINAVWMLKSKDAKIGQLDGADLSGFIALIDMLGKQAAVATGFPASKFGVITSIPQTEGAVVHDEIDTIRGTEDFNRESGAAIGYTIDMSMKFKTGKWPGLTDRTVVQWHNPATPTEAQRADALTKLTGGKQVLSVEGAWDEMGWSEPRKQQERERLRNEMLDQLYAQQVGGLDEPASTGPSSYPSTL